MRTGRVLVVDDDPQVLKLCTRSLRVGGYDVLSAKGPRQALQIIRNNPPLLDVVLSDVEMPEIRGTTFVQEVAQRLPSTACLLMTAGEIDASELPVGVSLLHKPLSP